MSKVVHFMGIAGSGMSSAAGLFKEAGWQVRGSDQKIYPPASDELAAMGIKVLEGYSADHLTPVPDLVIVGNVISRNNVEAEALLKTNIPYTSMAQGLGNYFLKPKQTISVSGTHGKTTTTSLMAHILEVAGQDPGLFVGGVPLNFSRGFKLGKGPHFVVEGDEYDTAFFEKTPKFLHYHPKHLILTSVEFDHADIYPDLDAIKTQFSKLISIIPPGGKILACADYQNVKDVAQSRKDVLWYSANDNSVEWTAKGIRVGDYGWDFDVCRKGTVVVSAKTRMIGQHNVSNAVACVGLALELGIERKDIEKALATFLGVKRRQEFIGEAKNVRVYDDFAHHPTAVAVTLDAFMPIKQKQGGTLWAIFEPRSNTSRRRVFQKLWPESFRLADKVLIAPVYVKKDALDLKEMLDPAEIAEDIRAQGRNAESFTSNEAILDTLAAQARPGDVVVFMSNGLFENLPRRLVERLVSLT